jgi:hypothetical protein
MSNGRVLMKRGVKSVTHGAAVRSRATCARYTAPNLRATHGRG